MLTEARRIAHNKANKKWRNANSAYFKEWHKKNPYYVRPCYNSLAYHSWERMKQRCTNPNTRQYRWYGAKGIKVLYGSFEQFIKDVGERPSRKHSIDRINNDGHYEPGNCKWSTQKEQCQNRGGMFVTH